MEREGRERERGRGRRRGRRGENGGREGKEREGKGREGKGSEGKGGREGGRSGEKVELLAIPYTYPSSNVSISNFKMVLSKFVTPASICVQFPEG